jgi:hypothetical protein
VKKLSQNQLTGQRGEHLVADRTLAMGFAFDGRNRQAPCRSVTHLAPCQAGGGVNRIVFAFP